MRLYHYIYETTIHKTSAAFKMLQCKPSKINTLTWEFNIGYITLSKLNKVFWQTALESSPATPPWKQKEALQGHDIHVNGVYP